MPILAFGLLRRRGLGGVTLALVMCGCSSNTRTTFDVTSDAAILEPAPEAGPKPPPFTDGSIVDAGKPKGPAEVFGHSGTSLYRVDPDTKAVTVVGNFEGCGATAVLDIALDTSSKMFGTSRTALYAIDIATARCTKVADAPATKELPNSLSFVPKGTLDPSAEALVGYVDDLYVRVDPTTGAITEVGKLDPLRPAKVRSSGDVVSVEGGPTYLTVTSVGSDTLCKTFDCLVEVDPKTGALVKDFGPITGKVDVFGIAFWAGAVYGFNKTGSLFEVTITGSSLSVRDLVVAGAPAGLSFFGAGSTTSAPVQPR